MVGPAPWLRALAAMLAVGLAGLPLPAASGDKDLKLGSTTTTENSGLMEHLIPQFESASGYRVRLVVRGTGEVLDAARRGNLDAVLTHDPEGEVALVEAGFGIDRRPVMANDFVIVGAPEDPAGLRGRADAAGALARVAAAKATFVSRGDASGTHAAERRLWTAAGIDPTGASGTWYLEAGAGMGRTLNIAAAKRAYTLVDRGTWLAFGNRRGLTLLVEGDARLVNRYSVMRVNPARHDHVNAAAARAFVDWITSPAGQAAIGDFRIGGAVAFRPTAR